MELYYFQVNAVCLIILGIVIETLRRTSVLPARRVAFMRLVTICMLVCFSDIFAWSLNGHRFPGSTVIQHASNMLYYAAITLESVAWMEYVNLRVKSLEENVRRRAVIYLPLALMLVLILINPLTGFLFTIDETGSYARGIGVYLHWLISWGYLFYASGKTLKAILSAGSRTERSQLMPLLWFVIPPAAAAVLQMFFYGLTSTQCGLTVSILIIVLRFLSDETSRDALTGLNNRRALENYLMDQLQKNSLQLTVMMCDVDRFKTINDTLGHAAGDLVLRRMSDSLKNVCRTSATDAFLCRYGGDEFIICGANHTEEEVRNLSEALANAISAINLEYSDKLSFSISIGSATGECTSYRDVEGLISMADSAMYSTKRGKTDLPPSNR